MNNYSIKKSLIHLYFIADIKYLHYPAAEFFQITFYVACSNVACFLSNLKRRSFTEKQNKTKKICVQSVQKITTTTKKKRNTLVNSNTNYRKEMKLVPINMEY